ncbi:MAG TPA: T9SS type A sorting domain-containing protein, partial [Saprospiraceae bacterium]|nr:T9SS type A sorting domain-containing protein [Saprospiraceae bacterium]HRP43083.1 T9SS type A sorting domain-containing protein [Saprospiraceae bacterium]
GIDDQGSRRAEVTLFPNPVSDYLLVTLSEYVPAAGSIHIVDMQGRTVATQRIYYGQNTIDMQHLPQGIYAWILSDGGTVVKEGKIVKK